MVTKHCIPLFLVLTWVLASCSTPGLDKPDPSDLLAADKSFSDLSAGQGMKHAFLKYAAKEVVILRDNSLPQKGKSLMANRFETFSDTGFVLTWEPLCAEVAHSGELGYTYGIYTIVTFDSTGLEIRKQGTYVSIWKRDEFGEWKYVLDSGNEGTGEQH